MGIEFNYKVVLVTLRCDNCQQEVVQWTQGKPVTKAMAMAKKVPYAGKMVPALVRRRVMGDGIQLDGEKDRIWLLCPSCDGKLRRERRIRRKEQLYGP